MQLGECVVRDSYPEGNVTWYKNGRVLQPVEEGMLQYWMLSLNSQTDVCWRTVFIEVALFRLKCCSFEEDYSNRNMKLEGNLGASRRTQAMPYYFFMSCFSLKNTLWERELTLLMLLQNNSWTHVASRNW